MTLTLPEGATATPDGYCARCGYVDPSGLHAEVGCRTPGVDRPHEEATVFVRALILTLNDLYPPVRDDRGESHYPRPAGVTASRIRRAVLAWADNYVPDLGGTP